MDKEGMYTIFPDDQDSNLASSSSNFVDMYRLFHSSEKPKRKDKKKKKKQEKLEKALADFLESGKKKKSKRKKGKKSKGKSKKSQKQKSVEFKYRMIEKTADKTLDTASNVIEMYAESKFFPNGRIPKGK